MIEGKVPFSEGIAELKSRLCEMAINLSGRPISLKLPAVAARSSDLPIADVAIYELMLAL